MSTDPDEPGRSEGTEPLDDAAGPTTGAVTPPRAAPPAALLAPLQAPDPSPGGGAVDRASVVALLGLLAYGALSGFANLAAHVDDAPDHRRRAALARSAVKEFATYERLGERLTELGVDPDQAVEPFIGSFEGFHARTRASDWLEALVKAYVGDGIAQDFYREIAAYVDPTTRDLVANVLHAPSDDDAAPAEVRAAIAADPAVGGRLALWARRLMGEALSQAQQAVGEHEALAALLLGSPDDEGAGAPDLAEIGRMITRLAEAHTRRMERLGLTA